MKVLFSIFIIVLCIGGHTMGQGAPEVFDLNRKLGRGINMGNMFEAPTETDWGNPYRADYFQRIASLGFQHVRIPIRWDTPQRAQQVAPYTLDPAFLSRIKQVIDDAHRQGLYVIINMHHHEALFTDPEQAKPRFLAQWTQIAAYFKDYDDKLLFEVLNEPNGKLTPELWNPYFTEALGKIRLTNPRRAVLMGIALYGGLGGVPYLRLPNDPNLIVSVHYYSPFRFTHQGAEWVGPDANTWLGTPWKDLEYERDEIRQEFGVLVDFAQKHKVPVHVGEFGAYNKADQASRLRWTTFLSRWFEQQGFSWAYWEFSAGFGIFNPTTNQYLQPLVDALVRSPMPPPTSQASVPLYVSAFGAGTDGWNLYTQASTAASLSPASNAIRVDIQKVSAQGWQVQLVKNKISLVKGRKYRVVFRGSASVPHAFTVYVGKASDPYTGYSDYKSLAFSEQEREYSFVFDMIAPSDPTARLVFDLGTGLSSILLTSVRVEELYDQITFLTQAGPNEGPYLSPNPSDESVQISGVKEFHKLRLYSTPGALLQSSPLKGDDIYLLDLKAISPGLYLIELEGPGGVVTRKLVKK